jgi:hypothetical protein
MGLSQYLLLCNLCVFKKCRIIWEKLCEVLELRPDLYILSLSCLDKQTVKKKLLLAVLPLNYFMT